MPIQATAQNQAGFAPEHRRVCPNCGKQYVMTDPRHAFCEACRTLFVKGKPNA